MFQYKNIEPLSSIQWLFLLKEAFKRAKNIYNEREGYLIANFDHFEFSHKNGGKITIDLSERFMRILISDDFYNQSWMLYFSVIEESSLIDFWRYFTEKQILDGFRMYLNEHDNETFLIRYYTKIIKYLELNNDENVSETEFLYYLLKPTELKS